jgi:hypothetical protein
MAKTDPNPIAVSVIYPAIIKSPAEINAKKANMEKLRFVLNGVDNAGNRIFHPILNGSRSLAFLKLDKKLYI